MIKSCFLLFFSGAERRVRRIFQAIYFHLFVVHFNGSTNLFCLPSKGIMIKQEKLEILATEARKMQTLTYVRSSERLGKVGDKT